MAQAPFVIQQKLTALTLAYTNGEFIADRVLPRVGVGSSSFKWSKYQLEDGFTIPDTRVGRKSKVNEIDWKATEQADTTLDYALEDKIPQSDILNAQAGGKAIDPQMRSAELLTDLVALDREQRVANLVFTLGNYPATQRATLSGTTQWSDYTNSNPVTALAAALDVPIIRPNVLVLGQAVWTQVRQHPKVTAAAFPGGGNASAGSSMVARQALADLLEIEEVLVGPAFYNTARPGQTASLARLWGKHAALIYRPKNLQSTRDVAFGFTAEWGSRIAGTIDNDPDIGMRGGVRVRVGESVKEIIAASDTGYFFQNAVA